MTIATTTARIARRLPPGQPPVGRALAVLQAVHQGHPTVTPRLAIKAILATLDTADPAAIYLAVPRRRQALARHVWSGDPVVEPSVARARAARRMVAQLAVERPGLSPAVARKVRVATGWVGWRLLDGPRGWDTALVTSGQAGVALGVRAQTATGWIKTASTATITIRQKRAGGGLVVALKPLRGAALQDLVEDHTRTIDEVAWLAEHGPSEHVSVGAVAILAVRSPLWGYVLGWETWDGWVAHLLGAITVTPAAKRRALDTLRQHGIDPEADPVTVARQIDQAAHDLGATGARQAAQDAADAKAAERLETLTAHRQLAAASRLYLRGVLKHHPGPEGDDDAVDTWVKKALEVDAAKLSDQVIDFAAARLPKLLQKSGWEAGDALALTNRIIGLPSATLIGLIMRDCPPPDAERDLRSAWVAGAVRAAQDIPAADRAAARHQLLTQLQRGGYEPETAARVAARIIPDAD